MSLKKNPHQFNMVRKDEKTPLFEDQNSRIVSDSAVDDTAVTYPDYMLNAYPHVHKGRKLFIFNHIIFNEEQKKEPRKGVQKDVDSLVTCFGRLKFDVYVFEDYTKKKIFQELEKVSEMDPKKLECVAFVFSTYGDNNQLYCFDTKYNEMEMLNVFKDKLPGIPKLFFLQCGRENSNDIGELPDNDMFMMYSTKAGQNSYRNTDSGAWFINALTMQLNNLVKNRNLLSVLQHVAFLVENEFAKKHGRKQTPVLKNKLTKDLYIGPEVFIKPENQNIEQD